MRLVSILLATAACDGTRDREPGSRRADEALRLTEASLEAGGVTACADPEVREAEGPWQDRRSISQPDSEWLWGDIEPRNTIAVGLMVGDLDDDGHLDVVAPTIDGLRLYLGETGGERVLDGLRTFGGFSGGFGSGGALADYDGDGDLDLYVTRVFAQPTVPAADGRNLLLRNEGGGVFTDVTDEAGVSGCGVHHRTGVVSCFRSMKKRVDTIRRAQLSLSCSLH